MDEPDKPAKISRAIFIVALASLFYVYEYFIRVSPSVITTELMQDFDIGAEKLGLLSAFFLYGYTFMQIPIGVLGDTFGVRKLLTICAILCGISTSAFALTDSFSLAALARFGIGVGSSFAYIGPLMLASVWLHKRYYAMISGAVQTLGCLGAIIGGTPISYLAQRHGWHNTIVYSGIFGLILAIMFWLIIRDNPPNTPPAPKEKICLHNEWRRVKAVCSNRQIWWIAAAALTCWAPIDIYAGLWGVPFLRSIEHVDVTTASNMTMWIWIGIAIGSPTVGWLSDYWGKRREPLIICGTVGIVSSIWVIYFTSTNHYLVDFAFFWFGAAASAQAVTFGLIADNVHRKYAGTAIGFNNTAVVLGGTIMQPIVGIILSHYWNGKMIAGVPDYSALDYRIALISIPICFVVLISVALFAIKETNCEYVGSED